MNMLSGDDIREIRKSLGMNTTEFATVLGVTTNTVARWEIGDRHPRWDTMVKINRLAAANGTAESRANGTNGRKKAIK